MQTVAQRLKGERSGQICEEDDNRSHSRPLRAVDRGAEAQSNQDEVNGDERKCNLRSKSNVSLEEALTI